MSKINLDALKKIIKLLENKIIIITISFKGGMGKTVVGLGLAQELNIPYITNDKRSVVVANTKTKVYDNIYLIQKMKEDKFLKNSNTVVIDLGGYLDEDLMDALNILLPKASLILAGTGSSYLDLGGSILTAVSLKSLQKRVLFFSTRATADKLNSQKTRIKKELDKHMDDIELFTLRENSIVDKAFRSKKSYKTFFEESQHPFKHRWHNGFISDWDVILTEVKDRIGMK
jgi:cellulose biosynthesis protein BcsQ